MELQIDDLINNNKQWKPEKAKVAKGIAISVIDMLLGLEELEDDYRLKALQMKAKLL